MGEEQLLAPAKENMSGLTYYYELSPPTSSTKSELTRDSMMYSPLYFTTDTVPQVFSTNQSGFFFRLMLTTLNGMFLVSRTRMVLSAKGQNLQEKISSIILADLILTSCYKQSLCQGLPLAQQPQQPDGEHSMKWRTYCLLGWSSRLTGGCLVGAHSLIFTSRVIGDRRGIRCTLR